MGKSKRFGQETEAHPGFDPRTLSAVKPYLPNPFHTLHSSGEQYLLFRKNLGPGNYAHLGVYKGGSVWCHLHGLKGTSAQLYAIDVWHKLKTDVAPEPEDKDILEATCKAAGFSPILCKGTTREWADKLKDLRFKFVFIDAAHDYKNCKQDWDLWSPLVEVDGEVGFHDVDMLSVQQVISEINMKEWEEVEGFYTIRCFRKKA